MTAMNVIVQSSAGAAYLLSDTACVGPDGTLIQFRSKLSSASIGAGSFAAISSTGMGSQFYWRPHLRDLRASSPTAFLTAIPGIFRAVEAEMIERGIPDACGTGHMSAVVAIYDHKAGEARGYAISNDRSLFPERPGKRPYQPYSLQPVRKYLTRFVGRPFPAGTNLLDPAQWNPHDGAAALIEAQRADLFGLLGAQHYAIGGHATLTKVSAAGVEHTTVKRWPDRLGRRIEIAPKEATMTDTFVAGINTLRAPLAPMIRLAATAYAAP